MENLLGGLGGGALGTLYVTLTAESAKLLKGMAEAELSVATGSAKMLKQATMMSAGLTAAFAVVGVEAIREFAKFDKAMKGSLAVMGKLSDETKKQLGETAKALSGETIQSAEELATAYKTLSRSGMDATAMMAALPVVTKLATAANVDASSAAELLTDATSALGLASEDAATNLTNMTRVSDVLAKASTMATADIKDFAEALTGKAGVALRAVNKDIEEGVAVLLAFDQAGIKGAEGGQALAQMLTILQKSAVDNARTFEGFGISVFDAAGKMKPMSDIIGQFEKSLAGATDEQKQMTLEMLGFQNRSYGVLRSLMGTSQGIKHYEEALHSVGGTTDDIANITLTSLSAQITITTNLLKDLLITIGEGLAPALTSLNEELRELVKTNTAANESLKETANVIGTALVYAGRTFLTVFGGVRDLLKVVLIEVLYVAQGVIEVQKIILVAMQELGSRLAGVFLGVINNIIFNINVLISTIPEILKSKLGLEPIKQIANNFVVPFKDSINSFLDEAEKLVEMTRDDIWSGLEKTTKGAAEETKKSTDAIANNFKAVATSVEQSTKQIGKAITYLKLVTDSAKTAELLRLLGKPEGVFTGAEKAAIGPTAAQLFGGMDFDSTTGKVKDSTKAADMLKAAGLDIHSTRANMLDPATEQTNEYSRQIKANEDKLKILEGLNDKELSMTKELQEQKKKAIEAYNVQLRQLQAAQAAIVVQSGQKMFDDLATAIAGFAGESSDAYKAMFAISKAFAIADAAIKIQQGIANALSLPYPANIVAAASVVSAAASIMTTIQSVKLAFDKRALGGPVSAGQMYLVGERGPEVFSPSQSGNIIPNDRLGGPVKVVVNNYTDATATVSQSNESGERTLSVIIKRLKTEIGTEIRDGRGDINRSMEATWGLRRGTK